MLDMKLRSNRDTIMKDIEEGQGEKCELVNIWEVLGRRWSLLVCMISLCFSVSFRSCMYSSIVVCEST
jgi:hypothetical protein